MATGRHRSEPEPEPEPPRTYRSWELPITPTLVVSTALATRDFQDVHHDRDRSIGHGSKDIFINILSTTGLVQRYVTDWAGPQTQILSCALRLGAPAHPYDTLRFTGTIVSEAGRGDDDRRHRRGLDRHPRQRPAGGATPMSTLAASGALWLVSESQNAPYCATRGGLS